MADAVIIGGTSLYNTWASLRTVFSNPYPGTIGNVEYPPYAPGDPSFKSAAAGSGLIRADFNKAQSSGTFNFEISSDNVQPNPSPPPTSVRDWYLWLDWWDYSASPESTNVPIEVQNELVGQTVTKSAGASVTISSSLFTTAGGRQYFAYADPGPQGHVTAVGKLTPIT